ncbi:MAG: ABC transporter permease subunit [Nitrososphaerales archaeon]|jgi:ABC-type Na+ efflux pump permease subunit
MRLGDSWTVAMKDISTFRRKSYILYSLVALPVVLAVVLPGSLLFSGANGSVPASTLVQLLQAELSILIMLAAILPSVIGSYSFIGEKVEKSLEPLLATPASDEELLLGKCLAAFLPSVAATYVGAAIFMAISDAATYGRLGYLLFPDADAAVILLLAVPFASILSVEFSVIVSSRVNDIRAAQQLGSLIILPMVLIFLLGETGTLSIDPFHLLIVSGILLVGDVGLAFVSRATFQREEILTRWK